MIEPASVAALKGSAQVALDQIKLWQGEDNRTRVYVDLNQAGHAAEGLVYWLDLLLMDMERDEEDDLLPPLMTSVPFREDRTLLDSRDRFGAERPHRA